MYYKSIFLNPALRLSKTRNFDPYIEETRSIIDEVSLSGALRNCSVVRHDLKRLVNESMLQQRLLINDPVDVAETMDWESKTALIGGRLIHVAYST